MYPHRGGNTVKESKEQIITKVKMHWDLESTESFWGLAMLSVLPGVDKMASI